MFSLFTNKIRKTPPRLSAQAEQQLLNDIGTSFGRALQNAPDDLKRDKTFLLKAITQQTPWVLRFASDECRSDKSLVLKAVQLEGYLLEYASQELREDRQVVLQAVQSQGQALKFAHSKYRNDCEIVQAAVNSDGFALQYASVELQKDRSLALMAVQKTKNGHTALGYVNLEFRKDREIVMAAVTYDYRALQYIASDELRMDKQIVLEAVKQLVLQVYHPTLVSDKSSLWWYMKQSSANQPAVLSLVSEELRNDEELMKDIDVIIEKGIEACRKESDLQFRRTVLERLLVDVSLTKKIGSNVETRATTSWKQEKNDDVQTIDSLTVGTVDWNDLRNQSVLSTQAKSEMKIVETVTNSTLERILVKLDDEKFGKKNAKITIEGNSFKSLVHNVKTIFSELLLLQHETEIILTYFDTNLCDDIVICNDHDVKDFMEFFKDSNVEYKNKFIRVSMTTGSKRQLSSSASSTVHSRSEKSQEFEKEGNSDKDHSFEKLRIHSMNSSSAFPNSEFIISSSSKSENNSSVFPNSGYIGSFHSSHADSSQQTSNKSNTTRSVTNQQDELSKIEKYLQSKYEKISYLARGGFGVVYHVIDLKSKKEKALKQLRLDDIENFNSALREALNMSKFSHSNL